jgi:hypothetical protein
MDDRPQEDKAEDRRRRGPLGDDESDTQETRRVPQGRGGEEAETNRIPLEDAEREPASERISATGSDEEDPETRVIRTPGASVDEATSYPGSYMEAAEVREARLKEIYGGVDWLGSFIGCVFALVCASVLLLILSSLVLVPLGFTLNLQDRTIDTTIIVGLVLVGLVLFVAYFCGGYVAGRLARFDGGRNGAATVLWGILLSFLLALLGGLLGLESLLGVVRTDVMPVIVGLPQTGLVGLGIVIGALLLQLLGGFLGGRVGIGYHTRIDHTT